MGVVLSLGSTQTAVGRLAVTTSGNRSLFQVTAGQSNGTYTALIHISGSDSHKAASVRW